MGWSQEASETAGTVEPGGGAGEPAAREAVGQLSAAVMVALLLVLLTTCVLIVVGLRRRWRHSRASRVGDPPRVDAWEESGRRVGLDDRSDVPREPGTG